MKTDTSPSIPIEKPGLYLFRGDTRLSLNLENNLAVFLFGTKSHTCLLALLSDDRKPAELSAMLSSLLEKAKGEPVEAKLFGLKTGQPPLFEEAKRWLSERKIPLRTSDVGRNLNRSLLVECAAAKVGIKYSRLRGDAELFSVGDSARARDPLDQIHTRVLILSENPVKRQLAKQAVEEYPNFAAYPEDKLPQLNRGKGTKPFPWTVVLILDDMESKKEILDWMRDISGRNPAVQFRWVGPKLPPFSKQFPTLRLLPPIEPLLLPEFKAKLRRAVFDYLSTGTSEVIPFRRKRMG